MTKVNTTAATRNNNKSAAAKAKQAEAKAKQAEAEAAAEAAEAEAKAKQAEAQAAEAAAAEAQAAEAAAAEAQAAEAQAAEAQAAEAQAAEAATQESAMANLIALVGEEKAKELIAQAVSSPARSLELVATQAAAQAGNAAPLVHKRASLKEIAYQVMVDNLPSLDVTAKSTTYWRKPIVQEIMARSGASLGSASSAYNDAKRRIVAEGKSADWGRSPTTPHTEAITEAGQAAQAANLTE